jgi:hypothetical protein
MILFGIPKSYRFGSEPKSLSNSSCPLSNSQDRISKVMDEAGHAFWPESRCDARR